MSNFMERDHGRSPLQVACEKARIEYLLGLPVVGTGERLMPCTAGKNGRHAWQEYAGPQDEDGTRVVCPRCLGTGFCERPVPPSELDEQGRVRPAFGEAVNRLRELRRTADSMESPRTVSEADRLLAAQPA